MHKCARSIGAALAIHGPRITVAMGARRRREGADGRYLMMMAALKPRPSPRKCGRALLHARDLRRNA